jgi:hypothetical protein
MHDNRFEKLAGPSGAPAQADTPGHESVTEAPPAVVAAVLCGVAAAWIAAGSVGLLGHPLRRLLVLVALLAALLVHRPQRLRAGSLLGLAVAVALAAWMIGSPLPPVNVGAAVVILGYLALASAGPAQSALLISSVGVAVLMFYRAAVTAIPSLWLAADSAGRVLGGLAGLITGQRLHVGATFAGLDFLVLTGTLAGLWLARTPAPRRTRALYALVAILGVHICYLAILSYVPSLLAPLPRPGMGEQRWWMGAVHKTVPWNVPVLAWGLHLIVIGAMLRWSTWRAAVEPAGSTPRPLLSWRYALPVAALLVAGAVPVVTSLYPARPNLRGKKIVINEKGFLNWNKPEHGSYGKYSGGMYGMLPIFLESLGAKPLISADLSDEDLRGADMLALIFPNEPWTKGQLDRIWAYVRGGGSLLVLGEHTHQEEDGKSRFNEALGPTDIQVAFDSATFAVGGWLQSYEAITHPTTAGVPDDRNQYGVVIGASLEARWPARPVLMGRWGWSDVGDVAKGGQSAMMGNGLVDPGEKLGDLVLAAEQRLGRGRVLAFGDTSGFTNGINVGSHIFTSRVFAYLAGKSPWAHPWWRELAGVLLAAVLVTLATRREAALVVPVAVLVFAVALTVCANVTARAGEVLPDGRHRAPNNLAYIDASHLESYSGESWRPEALGGFSLTLMRDGYLTLSLREVSARRLQRAGLLVSIAPSRPFSARELAVVRDFVAQGGIFIITAGYDSPSASHALLSEFGFAIGAKSRVGEPEPMGHFKSPYLRSSDQQVYVRFHAGWPVMCKDDQAQVISYGREDMPIILVRQMGAGKVVAIGDACFASDQNLESEDGQPVEGLRENADFWRWFISHLRGGPPWLPAAVRGPDPTETLLAQMDWKAWLSPAFQSVPLIPSEGGVPGQPAQEVQP